MGDSFELTFDYPIPDADWDKIMDVEFENTKSITFRTKSGKTVEFAKVSEEFEWCHDCKEYDAEQHCCHRWTKVIRSTVEELRQERPKGKWIDTVEGTYCSNCNEYPYDDGEYHIKGWSSDFCPNCGADMREES